jgi:5-methyltetrahydropteroyltriglutamate--homocysteine methyltransferase
VRLAKLVDRANLMAGTDCGFGQGPFARRVHPIMWAKVRRLSQARGSLRSTYKRAAPRR